MENKISRGQFFTQKNIFNLPGFSIWWNSIPLKNKDIILEPFAGANNIIKSLQELNLISNYHSYDIEPKEASVKQQDTLKRFPKGYNCIVTNPPYLSKNSATRKKLDVHFAYNHQDLYEVALHKCLDNADYVAAIIPESFITTDRFKKRLHSVISLAYQDMFFDTEHPVCLALFTPQKNNNFKIYRNDILIGDIQSLNSIRDQLLNPNIKDVELLFNDKHGNIHFLAVDNTINNEGLFFTTDNIIDSEKIKKSSRINTRISLKIDNVLITDIEYLNRILSESNRILKEYRILTGDVFMTSFKGLRKDSFYRRRLDFYTAKLILTKAIENIKS